MSPVKLISTSAAGVGIRLSDRLLALDGASGKRRLTPELLRTLAGPGGTGTLGSEPALVVGEAVRSPGASVPAFAELDVVTDMLTAAETLIASVQLDGETSKLLVAALERELAALVAAAQEIEITDAASRATAQEIYNALEAHERRVHELMNPIVDAAYQARRVTVGLRDGLLKMLAKRAKRLLRAGPAWVRHRRRPNPATRHRPAARHRCSGARSPGGADGDGPSDPPPPGRRALAAGRQFLACPLVCRFPNQLAHARRSLSRPPRRNAVAISPLHEKTPSVVRPKQSSCEGANSSLYCERANAPAGDRGAQGADEREHFYYTRLARSKQACAARVLLELSLDAAGWPWSRQLSLWLDALVLLEEGQR